MFFILEQQKTDKAILHKWDARPSWSMPGPVAKLFNSGLSLIMGGSISLVNNTWQIKYTPSTLADKILLERTLRIVTNDNGITQYSDYILAAKIFGLGGLLESTLEKLLRTEADQTSAYMNTYLKALANT